MPRALLSVSDKTGIVDLARALTERGFELISTGGTARVLTAAGLRVVGVSTLTGLPEMMDGRVKTLHPALHGAILARRDRLDDLAALERFGYSPIDLVVVNLYPFAEAARNPDTPFEALLEQIDVGGPSLVRAAAKNFRGVLVVVDPADYGGLVQALGRPPDLAFRFALARKAFAHTAAYDAAIIRTLSTIDLDLEGRGFERRADASGLAAHVDLSLEKIRDLRYGENPHQRAACYREAGSGGLGGAAILQGKELSYTNLLDLDAALRIVHEFDEPTAAIVKHTNPCGVAIGPSAADAYLRARDADSLAAFGGIVGVNRPIDVATAEALTSTFIEAVVAPAVDGAARGVLAQKANMRVVTVDRGYASGRGLEIRSIVGAVLMQEPDSAVEAAEPWDGSRETPAVVSSRKPTPGEWEALRFAWRICAHVKSNAVVFTDRQRTLAIGAGQMSRVDAVHAAILKARLTEHPLVRSVAASDAFFPFRDGVDAVAGTGATAVVQPGGSVRDRDVIAAADEHGLAMVFTGRRHFRH